MYVNWYAESFSALKNWPKSLAVTECAVAQTVYHRTLEPEVVTARSNSFAGALG